MKQFQPSESLTVGFLLALTGGLLDAYSYLNRGEVFATAETGNIVLMGINLAQQNWSGALHYLLPVLAFTAGILAAEWVRRRCDPGEGRPQRLHWRLPLLLAECGAILVVSALPMGPLDPLANIIISFASALQVESFRNIQGYGCVTTMCTGNLRSGTENLFHWLSRREPKAPPQDQALLRLNRLLHPGGGGQRPGEPAAGPADGAAGLRAAAGGIFPAAARGEGVRGVSSASAAIRNIFQSEVLKARRDSGVLRALCCERRLGPHLRRRHGTLPQARSHAGHDGGTESAHASLTFLVK